MNETITAKKEKTPQEYAAQVGRIAVKLAERINRLAISGTGEHDSESYSGAFKVSEVVVPSADGSSMSVLRAHQLDTGNSEKPLQTLVSSEKIEKLPGFSTHVANRKTNASVGVEHLSKSVSTDIYDGTHTPDADETSNARSWITKPGTANQSVGTRTITKPAQGSSVAESLTMSYTGQAPESQVMDESASTMAKTLSEIRGQLAAAEIARQQQR